MRIEIGANESGQRVDKFCRKWLKDVPLGAIFKAFRKGDIRVNEKSKAKLLSARRRHSRSQVFRVK